MLLVPNAKRLEDPLLPKVPMVATLIISTPYHRMAFDIVGPLQRTKSGYGHVLSATCMGTRYPYCIPLKRIDAISVAEGLMDISSLTGIPHEILTTKVVYSWVDFALNCASY